MSWAERKLGELIEIKHGYAFKSKFFSENGKYVLLTPGNCYETGGLKSKGDKEKYYIGDIPDNFVLKKGDLLLVMTDLVQSAPILGGAFIIPENDKFLHNQRLGLVSIKNSTDSDKKYLYYLLNSESYRGQVRGAATGATVRHTAPQRIYNCKVKIPSIKKQRKIASILSTYDDLIENNRQRIQLLEESARLLYREWFVRLRFPGHEHVKIIDGVPEGWEKSTLGDNIVLNYGKSLKADDRIEGPYPVYGSSGIVGTHKKPFARSPGIIVGRKGNVGSVFWSSRDFHPIDTVYYIDTESSDYYLYNALQHMQFVSSDAAVPGLNRNYAYSRLYLLPSENISSHFENIVAPIYGQTFKLDEYNRKLKQARDLLLPRLMNGEIEV